MRIEHVGRFSYVVIDTDQDQIVSIHQIPPRWTKALAQVHLA
jgi:hypothetical protein